MTAPVVLPVGARLGAGFRIEPILGDGMMPTLREGWDYVIVQPCHSYEGEWIYMIDDGGCRQPFRASGAGRGKIRLFRDNKHYPAEIISRDDFNALVVARVIADLKVRDNRPFLQMMGAAA